MKKNKFAFLFLIYGVLSFHYALSQDLRDADHTRKFAEYLFKTRQYVLASEEYERLVYFEPQNTEARLRLIQVYRFSGKYQVALNRLEYFYYDSIQYLNQEFAKEYYKNLVLDKNNPKALDFLNKNINLDQAYRQTHQLGTLLLEKQWDTAFYFALKHPVTNEKKNADLHALAFRSKDAGYKKPFTAAIMSTIVPGTGKMYTKNWKDGFLSMMFVGVNTWQAYRGFSKSGKNSVYGWVFAGLATGFYIGNIFGSHKSAKKYNKKIDDDLYNEAWHLVVDDF
ncbi:MAG: hypothetical protein U0W24_19440 [Bacteroidales bacterium]